MKSVLISIKPRWCELIASGKKTIEVRKNRPKLETPFKCYIYMTAGNAVYPVTKSGMPYTCSNVGGKVVIGEFVCDEITYLGNISTDPWCHLLGDVHESHKQLVTKDACLTEEEILKYGGKYGWHISDLVIYDEPVDLRWFTTEGDCDCRNCRNCFWFDGGNGYNVEADCNLVYEYLGTKKTLKPLFRPPQSWCYVEMTRENMWGA